MTSEVFSILFILGWLLLALFGAYSGLEALENFVFSAIGNFLLIK